MSNSKGRHTEFIVADIETSIVEGAAGYTEIVTEAPRTYKDPEKIAEYIEKANREQLTKAALDVDLCRIVAIGFWLNDGKGVRAGIARDEQEEARLLEMFWRQVRAPFGLRTIVGHNILDFDMPVLQRRSLYLGVSAPLISLDRYRHPNIEDTQQVLSYNGKLRYRSLGFYCRRFGIHVADAVSGASIPALVAMKDWTPIKEHVTADVEKTRLLAERIGVIDTPMSDDPAPSETLVEADIPF